MLFYLFDKALDLTDITQKSNHFFEKNHDLVYIFLFQSYKPTQVNLDGGDLQSRWKSLGDLLSLLLVVKDESVKVLGTSNLELGLLDNLTGSVDLLVGLDGSRGNVSSLGQLQKLLGVLDFSLFFC